MSKKPKELTLEEKRLSIRDMRPIDDVFFEILAQSKEVCQEMLRVILEDDKLVVIESITQSSERNLYGRSVRLDALCELSNGTRVNIEVQRSNNDDHLRRARFNASSITVKESNPGTKFENVPDLYIVYISEFDFFKGGKTIYHVDKILRRLSGNSRSLVSGMKAPRITLIKRHRKMSFSFDRLESEHIFMFYMYILFAFIY